MERAPQGKLSRKLGTWDLILIGIGGSIGSGIFVITGTVAKEAGPGVALSFLLAGLACVLNALCYAELSSRFPALVGGAYLYARSTFDELTAFLVFAHLMLDYHIGAANISRSLASYLATMLQSVPFLKPWIPSWIGPGGYELLHGWISVNAFAPLLLVVLTFLLCSGVRESALVNGVMTVTKVFIVLLVILAGAFEMDTSYWTPFFPNGFKAVVSGATVVFFAYVGFDAVANSAEESKNPKRDLPIGILVSLSVCAVLYMAVCLVLTAMVPYYQLSGDAPLAKAFLSKGDAFKFIAILIDIGAVAGLTTTLLVGLYVQSRLYLGLGRDGLLPSFFTKINPEHHTPVWAQAWAGFVASFLALVLDVSHLSHILSVGCLVGYSVVSACVVMLRLKHEEAPHRWWHAVFSILAVAATGLVMGFVYRTGLHYAFYILGVVLLAVGASPMYFEQEYALPVGFPCPLVPTLPLLSICFNMFLFAQLHWEAFVRFFVLSLVAVAFYHFYSKPRTRALAATAENAPLVVQNQ